MTLVGKTSRHYFSREKSRFLFGVFGVIFFYTKKKKRFERRGWSRISLNNKSEVYNKPGVVLAQATLRKQHSRRGNTIKDCRQILLLTLSEIIIFGSPYIHLKTYGFQIISERIDVNPFA